MWRGRDSLTIVAIALLALSLVLGHHIHIGENPDNGTIAETSLSHIHGSTPWRMFASFMS